MIYLIPLKDQLLHSHYVIYKKIVTFLGHNEPDHKVGSQIRAWFIILKQWCL